MNNSNLKTAPEWRRAVATGALALLIWMNVYPTRALAAPQEAARELTAGMSLERKLGPGDEHIYTARLERVALPSSLRQFRQASTSLSTLMDRMGSE